MKNLQERDNLGRKISQKIGQPIIELRLVAGRWRAKTVKYGVAYEAYVSDLLKRA